MKNAVAIVTLDTTLIEGLSHHEALARAKSALRAGEVGRRVAAFYLAELADTRGFRELGSPTMKHFAEQQLGEDESEVRHLITVGRALRDRPTIDAYFADGRICWSVVTILTPITTPETEGSWAVWAITDDDGSPRRRTVDEVRAQAKERDKGDLPTAPARRVIKEARVQLGPVKLNPTDLRMVESGRAKLEAMTGEVISNRDLLLFAADIALKYAPDGTIPGWKQVNDRAFLLHVYPRSVGSPELVTLDERGEELTVDRLQLLARPRPMNRPVPKPAGELDPENHGPEAPEDQRDAPTTPAQRLEVLTRDGSQCRSCGAKDHLHVHHRRWRRYGGKTERANLLTLCERCHSLVHARYLIVLGDCEGELTFLSQYGERIAPPTEPVALPVVSAPPPVPAEPLPAAQGVTAPQVLTLDRLPEEVDAAWWARHQHLLSWNERQGELELTPGLARDVCAPASVAARTAAVGALADLVGQSAVRARLEVAIAAARKREQPLGHVLLAGPAGLGKSSLARTIAAELGVPLSEVQAPTLKTPDALVRTLASLEGGVLLLDELHALPTRTAETLYGALDTGTLTVLVREELRTRTLRLRLRPFTLIGATTEPDRLPAPLLSRLDVLRLERYTTDELATIATAAAQEVGLELAPDAASRLAHASHETPRRALALVRAVHDEATVAGVTSADVALVERALARQGVDARGLDPVQRRCLDELGRARRPLGSRTLAARLDMSPRALRTQLEPLLIRRRLVRVTARGRALETGQEDAMT